MRTHSSLILIVHKTCWRLGLRIAVVLPRHGGLVWWGIAVVSSRRAGGIIEGLIRVHDGTDQRFLETGGGIGIASQAGLGDCKAKAVNRKRSGRDIQPVDLKRVAERRNLFSSVEAEDALERCSCVSTKHGRTRMGTQVDVEMQSEVVVKELAWLAGWLGSND